MEQFFLQLISEKGMTAGLFLLTLFGFYKLAKYLGAKAIKTYEENLKLQRQAQERKDLEFLKSVGEISKTIKSGDDNHILAHKEIKEVLISGHEEIKKTIKNGNKEIKEIFLKK